MKRSFLFVLLCALVLVGCTSVKSTSSGMDNESFLEFLGDPHLFTGGVDVDIDGTVSFNAQVEDSTTENRLRGKVYSVKPGVHVITVTYDGNVIYKQKVMLSNQETRKIKL